MKELGKIEEALEWYFYYSLLFFSWNKALQVDPKDTDLLDYKGTFLKELGRFEEAIEWYLDILYYDNLVMIKLCKYILYPHFYITKKSIY